MSACLDQFAEDIAVGEEAVGHRLDAAVALRVGPEIDCAVLGKVDLAGPSMRAQEFSGVIGAGERHGVEAAILHRADEILERLLGNIPGVGIERAVGHRRRAAEPAVLEATHLPEAGVVT